MSEADEMFDALLEGIRKMQFYPAFDAMNFDYAGAYEDYASAINKSAKELSTTERQQAVLNQVLKDGDD